MQGRMCETIEGVRRSQKMQGAVMVLRGSSKKPEFKDVTIDRITGSIDFFRRALAEFLTIDEGAVAHAEADSQGGVFQFSKQVENVERLILQDQLDGICIGKGYSSTKFAQFLAEALEFDKLKELQGFYELAEAGDEEIVALKGVEGGLTGIIAKIKEGGKDYAKKVIAACVLDDNPVWVMILDGLEEDKFFADEDSEFIALCKSFCYIKGLASFIEMNFNKKSGGMYVIEKDDPSVFAERMYEMLNKRVHWKGSEFNFSRRMKRLTTIKEIFRYFGEKGFFCIEDLPVVEPNELGALHVTYKKGWVRR